MGVPRGWWAEGKGDTRVARWSGIELKKSMFKEEEKSGGKVDGKGGVFIKV